MGASLPQVTLASTTSAAAFPRRSLSSVLSGAVKVPTPALTTIAMEPHTHRQWRALRVPTEYCTGGGRLGDPQPGRARQRRWTSTPQLRVPAARPTPTAALLACRERWPRARTKRGRGRPHQRSRARPRRRLWHPCPPAQSPLVPPPPPPPPPRPQSQPQLSRRQLARRGRLPRPRRHLLQRPPKFKQQRRRRSRVFHVRARQRPPPHLRPLRQPVGLHSPPNATPKPRATFVAPRLRLTRAARRGAPKKR